MLRWLSTSSLRSNCKSLLNYKPLSSDNALLKNKELSQDKELCPKLNLVFTTKPSIPIITLSPLVKRRIQSGLYYHLARGSRIIRS